MIGSFPTYTLGNVMAAQFFDAAAREPDVAAGLDQGDYAPLARWLWRHVHRHGRTRAPAAILAGATGSALDPAPYLAALGAKVDRLTA